MRMTNLPELIVFDLAGTTVKDNRDVQRVLQQTLRDFQIFITLEEADAVMGIPKPVAIRLLLSKQGKPSPPSLVAEIHESFVKQMKHFYESDPSVTECLGVSEMFSKLKKAGVKVVVDTGFDRQVTDVLIQRMGWADKGLIDESVTSDEVENGRPHPDMIWRAMHLTGLRDAKKVAKVGDTMSDLQEGHAAGCRWVIGVTTGAFSKQSLMSGNPTHLVEEVNEITGIFGLK